MEQEEVESEEDRKSRLDNELNWQAQRAEGEAIMGFESLRS